MNIGSSIIMALGIAVIAVVAFMVSQTYLKQNAIDACFASATVESANTRTEGETTYITTYKLPIDEWYSRCMKEKGYQ